MMGCCTSLSLLYEIFVHFRDIRAVGRRKKEIEDPESCSRSVPV